MTYIYYSEQIAKKTFYGINTKDAYMKAVKWYASNVIANDKLKDVHVEYTKGENSSIVMKLFATLNEEEVMERHCACCKEMHRSFFINQSTNCDRCNIAGYKRRLEKQIKIKAGYCKELLSKILKEEEV